MSASLALEPPFGGIAPLPLIALAVSASTPCAARGAHAALSPTFGAPATPVAWHALQTWLKSGGGPDVAAAVAVVGDAAATCVVPGVAFGIALPTCALRPVAGVASGRPALASARGMPPVVAPAGAVVVEGAAPAAATVVVVAAVPAAVVAGGLGSGKLPPDLPVM